MGGWFLSVGVGLRAPLAWASSTTGVLHTSCSGQLKNNEQAKFSPSLKVWSHEGVKVAL